MTDRLVNSFSVGRWLGVAEPVPEPAGAASAEIEKDDNSLVLYQAEVKAEQCATLLPLPHPVAGTAKHTARTGEYRPDNLESPFI